MRNESDGTVYIEAEGEEEALLEFLAWCKMGPKIAWVEKVKHEFSQRLKNFYSFGTEQKVVRFLL